MPSLAEGQDPHDHQRLRDHQGPEYPARLGRDDFVRRRRLSFLWEIEPVGNHALYARHTRVDRQADMGTQYLGITRKQGLNTTASFSVLLFAVQCDPDGRIFRDRNSEADEARVMD